MIAGPDKASLAEHTTDLIPCIYYQSNASEDQMGPTRQRGASNAFVTRALSFRGKFACSAHTSMPGKKVFRRTRELFTPVGRLNSAVQSNQPQE
jgi:hypothetical protein